MSSNLTRDPLPSMVLAPAATNKDSIRVHSKVEGDGRENTALSVLSCLLFMVSNNDIALVDWQRIERLLMHESKTAKNAALPFSGK
ncbi:hypothetical protein [Pseudomonas sp. S2_C03]